MQGHIRAGALAVAAAVLGLVWLGLLRSATRPWPSVEVLERGGDAERVPMLRFARTRLGAAATKYVAETPLRWRAAMEGMASDDEDDGIAVAVLEALERCELEAYFWELPPASAFVDPPFEFVLARARVLEGVEVDQHTFSAHTAAACTRGDATATFENLGGDAVLIAPCEQPGVDARVYAHAATFFKGAPRAARRALLRATAAAALARAEERGSRPLWVSTSGAGVSYLHLRLDSSPKYYVTREYTRF